MGEGTKIFIALLLVLSIVSFTGAAYVYTRAELLKEDIATLENENLRMQDDLRTSQRHLEEKIMEVKIISQEKSAFAERFTSLEREAEALSQQLAKEILHRESIQKDYEQKVSAYNTIQNELGQKQQEFAQLQGRFDQVNKDKDRIALEKTALVHQLKKVESDLKAALAQGNPVELEELVVTAPADPSNPMSENRTASRISQAMRTPVVDSVSATQEDSFDGKVLIYNEDYNFVIIDVGKSDEVRIGKMFEIINDGQVIAKVRVEKVYERMSAAVIVERPSQATILKNSSVKSI